MQQYIINQYFIKDILSWVQSNEIAIPEIQRPFVWSSIKVRDLMDSIYKGFPVGYIIVWRNPSIRLKDGSLSSGKKIVIDGQQRITALRAAILGEEVLDKEYRKMRIRIAFNPIEEKFETLTPAIEKDVNWIGDISEFLKNEGGIFALVDEYKKRNPKADLQTIQNNIDKLYSIKDKQLGFIELKENLDIETVTEIFIRINSEGVVLSQADFAMSRIAAFGDFGINLRKAIDYFAHTLRHPEFIENIKSASDDFTNTEYYQKILWAKNLQDDIYQPDYTDIIRVGFTKEFNRGRLRDLVSLLSGRNFETRAYEEAIVEDSYNKLKNGVLDFVNKTHYERFSMIVKAAGFEVSGLIRSKNALNFAYILYLKLRSQEYNDSEIERIVSKWLIMSLLIGRYSGSPESQFDTDIRNIVEQRAEKYLEGIERAELSDTFWSEGLVRDLVKSSISSPYLKLFWAAQVKLGKRGFLSTDIKVRDMIIHRGDIHHIFPKKYLESNKLKQRDYNQIANFAYTQSEINIKIGAKSPKQYFTEILEHLENGVFKYSGIKDKNELENNLKENAIPVSVLDMEVTDYQKFLEERQKLMANMIREYYQSF
ncbi:MAG: hypothetical protein COV29_00200 [Candidatus Yanofskybacteria bacterium CG10_big_fil_rev_8_21_14_0_10_36_16]|uniref:GmrSD restriction endonucleases N-terminal domain-containing protein n=1 Tax=Candidatus Yanofskybacteria bacterium CG10_big_fil_rev_8_21_14_0_10_36_16 TaxID=1975096 RepID=A0A2J0Q8K2_9BACT|nr:MAG: hypothetical protein COV29_00200 [Candidatus Yanofskybacteria bacterium CG10_big_fil_rev_8_21_14_0_10_36_16]